MSLQPKLLKLDESNTSSNTEKCSSFVHLVNSPEFVDKTLFVYEVFERPPYILLTAPPGSGKSSNLDTLRCFLDGSCPPDVFSKLKIGQIEDIMELHGQYPVLWIDNGWFTPPTIRSLDDAVAACRQIMHQTFKQHSYLLSGRNLCEDERQWFRRWCDDLYYKSLGRLEVGMGLTCLCRCLYEYHKKRAVLLIDDFDSIYNKAVLSQVDESTLQEIIDFYACMVGVVKHYQKYVGQAVFMGVAPVPSVGLASSLSNVLHYKMLENGTLQVHP